MQLATAPADGLAPAPSRAQIQHLEAEMRKLPQLEIEPQHTFGPGFYARTITIPAGATLTGKVHATEHVFILSKGELLVVTEEGRQLLKAPCQLVCRAGLKRAGHAITEVVCTNVHITSETDLAKLEATLIEAEALPAPVDTPCLG
jgi:hypothetical protein